MFTHFPVIEFERSSADFPELWNIHRPPSRIFVQGTPEALSLLDKLPERGLGIVGTRTPQKRTEFLVRDWVGTLRRTDLIIVSGLAKGIDGIAHRAALEAGLPTIAVLGNGLPDIYPREHQELGCEILRAGGLLISELPPHAPARPAYFIERNRLIAGWSKAVWVVEAGFRSGALNTAKWARENHRICLATPGFPDDPSLAGNQLLIDRDHAIPIWGPHSLGVAWLEFSSYVPSYLRRGRQKTEPQRDLGKLCVEIDRLTAERGGVGVSELLDWAASSGWPVPRFFASLKAGLENGNIFESGGTLLTSRKQYDHKRA